MSGCDRPNSYTRCRKRRHTFFRPGHPYHRPENRVPGSPEHVCEESELPEQSLDAPNVHRRLRTDEAADVLYCSNECETSESTPAPTTASLPFRLRPSAAKEIDGGTKDENIFVNIGILQVFIKSVHSNNCKKTDLNLKVTKRNGLCISLQAQCSACHFKSNEQTMTETQRLSKRGPETGLLNQMVVLPVLKSKMGMSDVSFLLNCVNVKTPCKIGRAHV